MPTNVPIQAIPNQSFTIPLDGNTFVITIKTTNGITAVSMTINEVDTIDNLIAAAGTLIIPAQYQEAGNFMFLTANYDLPIYTQFNVTQTLVYFTAAELTTFRTPVSPPITAAYFNPIANLPLRFSPQGYI